MKKIKAIVLKTEGRYMWVATEDRDFKRFLLPSNDIKPGQVVYVTPDSRNNFRGFIRTAAASCILIGLVASLSLFFLLPSSSAAAYLALDINPSFELTLNGENRVSRVTPLDEEAEILLKDGIELKNKDVYKAVDKIINKTLVEGYISPEKENLVLLTIIPVKKNYEPPDALGLKERVTNRISSTGARGKVGIQEATPADRERARRKGLSVNSYLLVKKATGAGYKNPNAYGKPKNLQEIVNEVSQQGIIIEKLVDNISTTTAANADTDKIVPPGPSGKELQQPPPGKGTPGNRPQNNISAPGHNLQHGAAPEKKSPNKIPGLRLKIHGNRE